MCSLGLDTWTQYLLLANTLPGFLLVLNLGNKDTVVIGFQTNGTSILELPSGPLPTIHTDVLPRSNLRSWNRPGNLHIEGSWPSTAFSSRARKTANQLPNRTSVAQKSMNFLIPMGVCTSKSLQSLPGSFDHPLSNLYLWVFLLTIIQKSPIFPLLCLIIIS